MNETEFQYCDGCSGHDCDPERGCAFPCVVALDSAIPTRPGYWLEQNCRMRPDGIYFDGDGNLYRPATKDEAQHGLNDTWPGDPVPALHAQNPPDLLAVLKLALHEMRHTVAPRSSFTDAVDAIDAAISRAEGEQP
jgi:hypothetical protein